MLITNDGTIIRTSVSRINVYSRTAGGVIIMRLDEDACINNVARIEPEEEIVIEEPTEEVAPVEIEEVIEEIVEPIDDEEDEVEIEELVELIIDEEEEEIIEEELTEEPIEEEPTTEVQPEESKEEPTEEEPTDSTPRPRGAKGGRRSKKQEAKLFEVKPEKQRPIAPFFDQTLF
jgi:hypothetical protein